MMRNGKIGMRVRRAAALVIVLVVVGGCIAQPSKPKSPVDTLANLEGLSLDAFFEESYKQLLLRDPEYITELGIAEKFGLRNDELTNISDSYVRETQQLQRGILDLLRTYNRDELTPEQKLSYDIYEWYLDDLVRQHEFMYYNYPVTYLLDAVQNDLIYLFTDIHPVANIEDAQDYVARLSQVDTKFEQLIEGLTLREEAGVVPPRFVVQQSLYGTQSIARGSARNLPFYTVFEEKLNALEELSAEEKQSLLKAAEEEINKSVIPAFKALSDYLEHLVSVAPTNDGVWQFPRGNEYYAYTLRHHTTTDLTSDEIHELGLKEIERIHQEMRAIFDELGYPTGESLSDLFDRVAQDSGYISGSQMKETYESLIEQANQNLDAAFEVRPRAKVIVIGGATGGYYTPGSLDGSRPGAFYADVSGAREPYYGMPTLAYHEAVPGHHLQIALAQELPLPLFRKDVSFNGYVEGWALYAEQLAWELGWYQDNPYGNLGRLQYEAFRAARLVVDTGIHAKGWTFNQALTYMEENVGFDPTVVNLQYEVSRYIAWPGQATSYKVGMLKILELRERAKKELKDKFDLKEFHNVILGKGSMPLAVLEKVVEDYIDQNGGNPHTSLVVVIEKPPALHIEFVSFVADITGRR